MLGAQILFSRTVDNRCNAEAETFFSEVIANTIGGPYLVSNNTTSFVTPCNHLNPEHFIGANTISVLDDNPPMYLPTRRSNIYTSFLGEELSLSEGVNLPPSERYSQPYYYGARLLASLNQHGHSDLNYGDLVHKVLYGNLKGYIAYFLNYATTNAKSSVAIIDLLGAVNYFFVTSENFKAFVWTTLSSNMLPEIEGVEYHQLNDKGYEHSCVIKPLFLLGKYNSWVKAAHREGLNQNETVLRLLTRFLDKSMKTSQTKRFYDEDSGTAPEK